VQISNGAPIHNEIFMRIRDEDGTWVEAHQFMGTAESLAWRRR